VLVTSVGDLLGFPRGPIVNFVLRHVRKQVPPWNMPGALRFKSVCCRPAWGRSSRRSTCSPKTSLSCNTPAARPALPRARCSRIATWCERAAGVRLDQAGGAARPSPIIITALPLYHIFSLTANCFLFTRLGAHNMLITNPRDFKGFVAELQEVPVLLHQRRQHAVQRAAAHAGLRDARFQRLKISLGGGMAVQAAVAARWKAVTGCILTQAWGLTETSPPHASIRIGLDFNGSIGLPISSTDISIRDRRRCRTWRRRGRRDLRVRTAGHARLLEPARRNREGFLRRLAAHRRHRAHRCEGFVFIEDRKKDMILVSGFNVYPNEVEASRSSIPACWKSRRSRSPTRTPARRSRCSSSRKTRISPPRS
jgi:long-chain acyl-CoA synthetase